MISFCCYLQGFLGLHLLLQFLSKRTFIVEFSLHISAAAFEAFHLCTYMCVSLTLIQQDFHCRCCIPVAGAAFRVCTRIRATRHFHMCYSDYLVTSLCSFITCASFATYASCARLLKYRRSFSHSHCSCAATLTLTSLILLRTHAQEEFSTCAQQGRHDSLQYLNRHKSCAQVS